MEAHGATLDALYDRIKVAVMLETDRPHALRAAIFACAKGGAVSIPGVYGGFLDKISARRSVRQGSDTRLSMRRKTNASKWC